jgi:hypothetical protein
MLERVGVARSVRVELKVDGDEMPTHDELVRVLAADESRSA